MKRRTHIKHVNAAAHKVRPSTLEMPLSAFQLQCAVHEILSHLQPGIRRVLVIGVRGISAHGKLAKTEIVHGRLNLTSWNSPEPEQLPFSGNTFSCVVAADFLDRIPQENRPALLAELSRVSSHYVIIASPFDSVLVRRAEQLLDETSLSAIGQPHPGAALHDAFGLPDLAETSKQLKIQMGSRPATLPGVSLRSWLLFEMLNIVAQSFHQGGELLRRFHKYYNERYAAHDHALPAYRSLILAAKRPYRVNLRTARALQKRFADSSCERDIKTTHGLLKMFLDSFAKIPSPESPVQRRKKKASPARRKK